MREEAEGARKVPRHPGVHAQLAQPYGLVSMGRNVRRSYKRDVLRRRVAAMGMPCHLCGRPIDYSLPAGHPMSFELDELVPVSRLPADRRKAAACDESNVAPAHRICNQRKGNRMPGDKGAKGLPIRRSRDW